jgi:hypothetical protein
MSEMVLPEAPASATFKFVDPETGGEVLFTLRDMNGATLIQKVRSAMRALVEAGATISPPMQRGGRGGGKPVEVRTGEGVPVCTKHGTPMRESKYGGFYCGQKDDSTEKGYCVHKVTEAGLYRS